MPRGLPQTVKDNLEKCRASAIAAVDAYNRPGPRFRTAQFIVLITIAWTALFHAVFFRRRRRPWYVKRTSGRGRAIRYQKVDGEPKHWDLSECIRQYFANQSPPERRNLEFLIGLRNKIEHRHLPELDASLYGECQAALLNLEELVVKEFGSRYALAEQLAVSLQFSQVIPHEKKTAARALARGSARSVADYVETFRGGLPSTVLNSMKYSFNVFLLPKLVNRQSTADAAVQFIRVDEASQEELSRLEKLNVLIREKRIPIANLDLLKPSQVVAEVRLRLPFTFTINSHTSAWRYFRVRPRQGDPHPERTASEYCVYDGVHRDYLYTRTWVEKLIRELSDAARFQEVTGRSPVARRSEGRAAAQHGLAADTAGLGAPKRGTILASWPRRPGATGQRPRRS